MPYILIIAIKNEENILKTLKNTIIEQSLQPLVLVIVDSGSDDDSYNILLELFSEFDLVHIIKQRKFHEQGYSHKNIAQAFNEGYAYAKVICEKQSKNFQFIGITGGTPILHPNYFEVLLTEIDKDPKIAFICGIQHLIYKNHHVIKEPIDDITNTALNDIGIYRRQAFEEIGGYQVTYNPEAVMRIKFRIHGWTTKNTNKTYFIKPRIGGSKIGLWKGYLLKGKAMYCLGYNPILLLLYALYIFFKIPPYFHGLALFVGYIKSFVRQEKKIADDDVLNYFGKIRLYEIFIGCKKKIIKKIELSYKKENSLA